MNWGEREAKLLAEIEVCEQEGERPRYDDLVEATGLDPEQVEFGLKSLLDGGFIDGIDATSMGGFDLLAIELRPRGRRAIGQWPSDHEEEETSEESQLKLFISHSSDDKDVASSLIELLRSALPLSTEEIRCTSVDGYRLPFGAPTTEQLRQEIFDSQTFIGLISPSSLRSAFVMFELGARWGTRKHLAPLLIKGAEPDELAGPLQDRNALSAAEPAQLHQVITDLASILEVTPEPPASYSGKINQLAELAAANT